MVTNYKVDPNDELKDAITRASKKSTDLTVPLTLITQSWYKTNNAIFSLKGPGKYEPLSSRYAKRKQKDLGFAYPALLGKNARIKNAITNPTNAYAINEIKKKVELRLGVRAGGVFSYAAVHQYGYKNIPKRPYLFVGGEAAAPNDLKRRVKIWIDLIENHIIKTVKKEL